MPASVPWWRSGRGMAPSRSLLASARARLHCIEFDPALARELEFPLSQRRAGHVHHADILTTDLAAMLDGAASLDVVGNLPYYITSEILLHLFAAARDGVVARAVLMMQREVAERIAAAPGASEYGALSALTQMHARVTNLFTLPPSAFSPPPEVYSTVLRLEFAPRFAELGVDFEGFNRLLRASFAQKRKTLANNLRAAGYSAAAGRRRVACRTGAPGTVRGRAAGDDGCALSRAGGCGRRDAGPAGVLKQPRGLAADALHHAVVVDNGLQHRCDVLQLDGAAGFRFRDKRVDLGVETEAVVAVLVLQTRHIAWSPRWPRNAAVRSIDGRSSSSS
jgi:16S rRNA (adenine1518-N6/adenine1519-N6)-dimethyltransferase